MAPIKLAIVGGGPSAFYVASRLLSLLPRDSPSTPPFRIHLYDRLWAPHGLVRYGVAPDHPEVKNCTHKFDISATDPRFRYFGNVNVGDTNSSIHHTVTLPLTSLFQSYTHVVFATGCGIPIRHPALSPSKYCSPAISLVHWYTQHPSRPSPLPLDQLSHVSVIGNGNVALDIARMLLTPVSVLEKYDVPAPVLAVLAKSQVRHVSIIGRRGPLEAAFTAKEVRELMTLPDSSMVPLPPSILEPPTATSTASPPPALTRQQSRILQLLRKGSTNPPGSTKKTWSLEFFRSPSQLTPPTPDSSFAELTLDHTILDPTHGRAIATGETSKLSTSIVIPSLGFYADPKSPFNDTALKHMRTSAGGRVVLASSDPSVPETTLKNVYASGWAATGAKGVLAATVINANALAETILSDWLPERDESSALVHQKPENVQSLLNPDPHPDDPPEEILEGLREKMITEYDGWKRIDDEEMRRGGLVNKERERMEWEEARTFLSP